MPKQDPSETEAERERARFAHNRRVREILANREAALTPAQRWMGQERHMNMNFEYNKYYKGYKYRPGASIVPTHLRGAYYAPPMPGGGKYSEFMTYRQPLHPSTYDWPMLKRWAEPEGLVTREKRPPAPPEPPEDEGSGKPRRRV